MSMVEKRESTDGLQVLVVDDDAVARQVTLTLLRRLGYVADAVEDGAKAVESVRNGDYRLVLMDLEMPVMGGLEATRRIRALPSPAGRIRIVAVTSRQEPSDREACLAAGMDGHLPKSIVVEALGKSIPGWLA